MSAINDLGIGDATFTADADLTSKQYHFVTVASTAGNVKAATGASNPTPLGVLQNSPSAGEAARVRLVGPTKLVGENNSTCNVTWGRYVFSASDGQAESVLVATSPVNALWLDSNITTGSAIGQAYLFGAGFGSCPLATN